MAINYNEINDWLNGTTAAQRSTLTSYVNSWISNWAGLANKIDTKGYNPVQSDFSSLIDTSTYSISSFISHLENDAPGLLEALSSFIGDNVLTAFGEASTNFPDSPSQSSLPGGSFSAYMASLGIGVPNRTDWAHLGNGWTDYLDSASSPSAHFGLGLSALQGGSEWGSAGVMPATCLMYWNPSSGNSLVPFIPHQGAPQAVAVGNKTSLWVISSGAVSQFNFTTYGWDNRNLSALAIAVGWDGDAWAIDSNSAVRRWTGQGWTNFGYAARHLYVANGGDVWFVDYSDNIYEFNKATYQFRQAPSGPTELSVGSDGTVWGVSSLSNSVYRYSGSSWMQIPNPPGDYSMTSIYVVDSAHVYLQSCNSTDGNYIQFYNGSGWTKYVLAPNGGSSTGLANQYVGADESIWSISNPSDYIAGVGNVYQFVSGAWSLLGGGSNIYQLASAKDGTRWSMNGFTSIDKILRFLKTFFMKITTLSKSDCQRAEIMVIASLSLAVLGLVTAIITGPPVGALIAITAASAIYAIFVAAVAQKTGCSWTIWGEGGLGGLWPSPF